MQTFLVILLVGGAAVWAVVRVVRALRGRGGCGCGCSGCPHAGSCRHSADDEGETPAQ